MPDPLRDGESDQPQAGGGGSPQAATLADSPLHHSLRERSPSPLSGEDLADPAATEAVGRRLAEVVQAGDVITLSGDLGMGKTSLARGLLAGLGLAGEAPSPSFAIVQPYQPPEVRVPVLHVDLYRIDDPEELEELGLDEARGDAVLLIEWPEHAGPGRWPDALALTLVAAGSGRRLTAEVPEAWRARWPT